VINKDEGQQDAGLADEELDELVGAVRAAFDVKDRHYGIRRTEYKRCFVGSEAVQSMIDHQIAADAQDALTIGNLLANAGIFHHVLDEHAFKNEYLFYRFAADEDHGGTAVKVDGSAVSWADFLPSGSTSETATNLQPKLPDRDVGLSDFEQEDLDSIGVAPLDEHNIKLLDAVHPKTWIDPEPDGKYNLVVIGAGSGGLVSAAGAAGVGARVALIEAHLLGGDCLNVGCVPSKALIRCARAAAEVRNSHTFGVKIDGQVSVDFGAVMERMRRHRASISPVDSANRFTKELGVDVYIGKARFTGPNTVVVNGKTLTFSRAVVATGGSAAIPPIPGLTEVPFLTNSTIFNLTELPSRMGVIGAGPIGMELAQSFQRFGSQVTVFNRSKGILPKEDPEAAAIVEASMREDGVTFLSEVTLKRIDGDDGKAPITVVYESNGKEHKVALDALLVATGRKPNVNGLGLEEAGIDFDARTGVTVNDRLQTTNANIFAVGDVASRYQFTHMADFMARMVIRNALFYGRDKVSDFLIPWSTYTEPEVAHVGLYEKDLEERDIAYLTFKREFEHVDRAILEGETEGFVKIHVEKGSDKILGATIVGPHAGDMISEISVAIRGKVGLGSLASVIHPYPTMAEAIRQCGDAYNKTRLTPTVKKILKRVTMLQR
jgi:pyruvate/2-oxoglutarate dehydrogenase complex dihydrolipoamide dehydrogenase (E3) component